MLARRMQMASAGTDISVLLTGSGTNIGNMTQHGGLPAAFDGITNQAQANTAYFAGSSDGTCGKQFSSAKTVTEAKVYASNDADFAGANTATLYIEYSDNGSSWTTAVTSSTKIWSNSEIWNPTSGDFGNPGAHTYWRARISSAGDKRLAELRLYGY